MSAFLSPIFGAGSQFFDNQGRVLAGGKINTYQAGTTSPLGTWTDSTQTVPNANPIILDSAGRLTQEIWLAQGSRYKFIVTDANNVQIGSPWDNVQGVNDVSAPALSEWVATGLTPSYISASSFSVAGNNTSLFQPNRRVKIAVTAGTVYGYVVSSTFGGGITTIVIGVDSISLDAGISAVSVGLLDSVNLSSPQQYLILSAPITVPSAATTPIGAATSINVIVSGTNNISAFDTVSSGIIRLVKFSGALTLINSAALLMPSGQNYTTVAGESALFRSLGSGNWECLGMWGNQGSNFPSGTRLGFQQTTVPTGWTKDTTAAINDSCMRIVTGAAGSGGTKGVSAASTDAYTLQIADIPAHTHSITTFTGGGATFAQGAGSQSFATVTGSTGGGGAHSHGLALKYLDFSVGQRN